MGNLGVKWLKRALTLSNGLLATGVETKPAAWLLTVTLNGDWGLKYT